jgi:tRNA (guanine37-N1)-methyltransferase
MFAGTFSLKLASIETEYRTFPMELLAGEDVYDVEVRQCGARFRFNFREVYWNSRLQGEHQRILDMIPRTAVVCKYLFSCVQP